MLRTLYQGTQKGLTAVGAADNLKAKNGRAVCPICGRETQTRVLPGTVLENFPLYCKRCRQTSIVTYREPEPESLS